MINYMKSLHTFHIIQLYEIIWEGTCWYVQTRIYFLALLSPEISFYLNMVKYEGK